LFSLLLTWNFESPDESDSELDVLKIKRRDHELEISSPEENVYQNTKKKVVTKVAVAKKILKKKIIANKKTLFNDEGEVCTQMLCVF
jgi:ATP-dependent RNA helicase DDX10/DBP4